MGEECETPCPICIDEDEVYREKSIHTLDKITEVGQTVRFYVEGGGSYMHTLTWGDLNHHCRVQNQTLPIQAGSDFNTYLSEEYMDAESPKIPYSISDAKHPECLEDITYAPTSVLVKRLELHFIYEPYEGPVPPVFIIPVQRKYFKKSPPLRFGLTDKIQLTGEALEKFVKAKLGRGVPFSDAGKKVCILDARVSFALEKNPRIREEDRSLFDRSLFKALEDKARPKMGASLRLEIESDYLLHVRAMTRPAPTPRREFTPESMGARKETVASAGGDEREKALRMIMRGVGILAGEASDSD